MKSATVICLCLLPLGCGRKAEYFPPVDLKGPSGSTTWSSSVGKDSSVPGIDQASIYAARGFVVWGDFSGGAGGRESIDKDGLKCQAHLWDEKANRRIEFTCETKDGKSGKATIEGRDYDLANGTLFLVSAHGGQHRVKQLKRDVSHLQSAPELKEFGKSDPDIVGFFAKTVEPK